METDRRDADWTQGGEPVLPTWAVTFELTDTDLAGTRSPSPNGRDLR
jgi:hypothetical protein